MKKFKDWSSWEVLGGIGVVVVFFSLYTKIVHHFSLPPEWINYYGSVLGAIISIGVIAFTLRQNKKHHIELMKEQERKHEELKQLQIETALHAKKQERLRAVITDLKDIYITTSPNRIAHLLLINSLQIGDSPSFMLSDYIKSIFPIRDSIDLMTNTNKDIIDLSELNYYTNTYLVKFAGDIAAISTRIFLNQQVDELNPIIDDITKSDEYTQYRTALFRTISEAIENIDKTLIQQTVPTKS